MPLPAYDVVVATTGRPSLRALLRALAAGEGPCPTSIVLVDDRRRGDPAQLGRWVPGELSGRTRILAGGGRGPAAARNLGWRACAEPWVAFLDDDIVPPRDWAQRLAGDLRAADPDTAASQGRVRVPRPADRRPTDWERNVAGLERARWATADLVVRRAALAGVGGFDERFPRAYREDSDLGLRLLGAGWRIVAGDREVAHPVPPAGPWVSLAKQAGNADDARMRALHGRSWRQRAGAPHGRLRRHVATTALGVAALGLAVAGRPGAARGAAAAWAAADAELAWRRIEPGPRTRAEVVTMLVTSVLLPPLACAHALGGRVRTLARPLAPLDGPPAGAPPPAAVLLDRDGTLVVDVPYNADPARVRPMPGARVALDRLRAAGVRLAVVSNQSGIARGLVTEAQLAAVNRRVEELLGPLGPWLVCPHAPEDGCACRKPAPGLVLEAAGRLDVAPERCAVVGDVGADVDAARAAGARAVLVPTPRTRREEVDRAPALADDLAGAVDLLLGQAR